MQMDAKTRLTYLVSRNTYANKNVLTGKYILKYSVFCVDNINMNIWFE